MPEIPLLAYFYNNKEKELIRDYLKDPEWTDSFALGTIQSTDIPKLKKEGILFDILADPDTSRAGIPRQIHSKSPGKRFISLDADKKAHDIKKNYYLISLKGPLLLSWKDKLEAENIKILENYQNNIYKVYTQHNVAYITNLKFVKSVRPFEIADTEVVVRRSLISEFDPFEPETERIALYDIKVQKEKTEEVLSLLKEKNTDILDAGTDKIRVRIEGTELLAELRSMEGVVAIEEYTRPSLHNDKAREIIHLMQIDNGQNRNITPLEGEGQIIGVADTGIDMDHPDFENRIFNVVARGRENDASDPNGHGTHVAGSVVGNGNASDGEIMGMAPKAKVFFQSLLDGKGGLGGIPLNLKDLFREAYEEGVRIHNNSWGALAESEYLFNSLEVDEFVHHHKDMLLVISAGNEGSASKPRNSRQGFVDWLSLGSPATAKNALTVGASRSLRQQGGFASLSHGQAWPDTFPDKPINTERVSGNAESVAGFSSRGPCGNESRIKPDVVAPGSDIVSARSSLAPSINFWGPYPGNRKYAFMGGTSMSAPIVAGYAALIREFFVKEKSCEPSAALLKAAVINSTRMLTGDDALADHDHIPNFHQGFGCIDMTNALPNTVNKNLNIDYIDSWQKLELQFNSTGQRFLFRIKVKEGLPLRLCLTWTDPPGRGLQNNLNLFLMHKAKQFKWTGNENLPRTITAFDRDNNVEIIRVDEPNAGEYLIAVQAANVIFSPQDFALVITGNLNSELQKQ